MRELGNEICQSGEGEAGKEDQEQEKLEME